METPFDLGGSRDYQWVQLADKTTQHQRCYQSLYSANATVNPHRSGTILSDETSENNCKCLCFYSFHQMHRKLDNHTHSPNNVKCPLLTAASVIQMHRTNTHNSIESICARIINLNIQCYANIHEKRWPSAMIVVLRWFVTINWLVFYRSCFQLINRMQRQNTVMPHRRRMLISPIRHYI